MGKSGIARNTAEEIVDLVRLARTEGRYPTIRAAIAIGRVAALRGEKAIFKDPVFLWACRDILGVACHVAGPEGSAAFVDALVRQIERGDEREGEVVALRPLAETGER